MPIPSTIPQEDYANFLTEASDLLQTIEQDLFHLKQDPTTVRVHSLMRAAHTLKGTAASIQLDTVKSVAHVLEDVFRVLYNPDVVIDTEVEALLLQAYECLRLPLMAEFTGGTVDEAEILERTATVLSQLQTKLGDLFDQDTPMLTSIELGFDMVQSMFESGIEQRLQALEQALAQAQFSTLSAQLTTEADVFLGLAESLQLAGFGAIAQTTLTALATHPDRIQEIAPLAIADFRRGQAAVLAGDRTQGGSPSPALQQFTQADPLPQTKQPAPAPPRSKRDGELPPSNPSAGQPLLPPVAPLAATNMPSVSHHLHTESATESATEKKSNGLLDWVKNLFAAESSDRPTLSTPPVPAETPLPPAATDSLDAFFDQIQVESVLSSTESLSAPETPDGALEAESFFTISETEPLFEPQADPASANCSNPDPLPHPQTDNRNHLTNRDRAPSSPAPGSSSPTDLPTPSNSASMPVVRVHLEQLQQLDYLTGELLINQNQQTTQDDQMRLAIQELLFHLQHHKRTISTLQSWSDLTLAINSALPQPLMPGVIAGFDALEMDRYNDFHQLVQSALNDFVQLEMVGESLENLIRQTRQSREVQKRLLTNLQDDLTIARMQPLHETLNRLPRVLQQLTTAHAKPVEMSLTGLDVLIDKTIAEKLYSPLLHLVRNAFDHGIESPVVRRAKGKPETGQIHIHAYHQGNRTLIEVRDDGQGIDWEEVADKAIALGLISSATAAELSTIELAEFLFQAGFSTARQVNDLSGRGVGLDMVRAEIQAMKGTVTVSSTLGQGTTFTLSLPLSFSITRLLICQHQDTTYALPINTIQQVILPQPDRVIHTSGSQRVLPWQTENGEQMVPVYALSHLLNEPLPIPQPGTAVQDDDSQHTPIILMQTHEGLWGLHVDQVIGEQELVIRPLSTTVTPPRYVYGCSILNDRQMALVIDPVLLQKTPPTSHAPSQTPSKTASKPVPPSPTIPHVLLIEDSLTVRHSLARTLQEHNYRVSQAGDGLEAFAYLQQNPDVHLIISDIEMPRMNGFEFLSQLRKTSPLQSIPVILLTSRSGSKYRQFASNLGANAFINKPSSPEELLPILNSLLTPLRNSDKIKPKILL